MIDTYLKILLLGSVFFYWPNMIALHPQMVFLHYGIMGLFGVSLISSRLRNTKSLFLGLVLIYALCHTVLWHFDIPSRKVLINFFMGFVMVKIVSEYSNLDYKSYGKVFFWFAIFNLAWMVLQKTGNDPIFSPIPQEGVSWTDTVGFFNARYAAGCYAVLTLPFVYALSPYACLVLLPLAVVGKSSTVILAFSASFLLLSWFRNRKLFWFSSFFLVLGAFFYVFYFDMPSGQFNKRFEVWKTGVRYLKDHIWLGFGLGGWAEAKFVGIQGNGKPEEWLWAHNEFLQYLFELGLIGGLFLFGYFRELHKKMNRSLVPLAAFMNLMIVSFAHFPFHVGRLAGFSAFIIGLMEAESDH